MGTNRWKKVYIIELPIPKISKTEQQPYKKLIDTILQKKVKEKILKRKRMRSTD